MADNRDPDVQKVMDALESSKQYHDRFVEKVEGRYRAYRGVLDRRSEAAQWTSKLAPAYLFQMVETIVAGLLDDRLRFRTRARPMISNPSEIEMAIKGAQAHHNLLAYQLEIDETDEKQRPFCMQGSIAGLTVEKNFWLYKEGARRRVNYSEEEIYGPFGEVISTVPKVREEELEEVFHDRPTSEIVDVRDFIWHEAAVSLAKCPWVIHRVWMTFEELQLLEKTEDNPNGIYKNVSKLKESRDFQGEYAYREQELFGTDRTKDMIEVLEYWTDDELIVVGNRNVLLRADENPFWFDHLEHKKPFVVCSSMPDLFRIPGISEVEVVEELQEAMWTLMNQRIDNTTLVNNAIVKIRATVDDPDAYIFAPGERWLVEDPTDVEIMSPDPTTAATSLQAEALLKGDMQNITGGMPFLSGTDSGTVDQETATGVSIVTSLAQRRVAAKKQNYTNARRRKADQWVALNQQFIREPRLVEILGAEGASAFQQVTPNELQARVRITAEPMAESLMRQERRAEAQAVFQIMIQSAPMLQALGQPVSGRAIVDHLLDAFDVQDKEKFYAAAPNPMLEQALGGGGGGGAVAEEGGDGTTNEALAAGPSSPSNDASMSPEVFLQRALASGGGGQNV